MDVAVKSRKRARAEKPEPFERLEIPKMTPEEVAAARAKAEEARGEDANREKVERIVISAPNFQYAKIKVVGVSPLVQHAFGAKARTQMIATQEAGQQAKSRRVRKPKDFDAVYEAARHVSMDGWNGIPCTAFRNAAISACRTVGFKMTIAKMSLFVIEDGYDRADMSPLTRTIKGEPIKHYMNARNSNGSTDIRCRPWFAPGWEAVVSLRWDADQFSATDIFNLMTRAGMQVGIQEGQPDSPNSAGLGWGLFEVHSL